MKMKTIRKDRLQNMEHYQFADHVLTLCKETTLPKLNAVLSQLEDAVAAEDEALNLPKASLDTQQMREADERRDKSYRALCLIEALDELESTAATVELITRYNNLVDNRRTLLAHRSATLQAARDKRTAEYAALLYPGIPALEERLGLPSGTLTFTGKTEGSVSKRYYEWAVAGQTTPEGKPRTLWMGVNKDGSLYPYEKVET